MSLILHEQRRIRCDKITEQDKQFKLSQILSPKSLRIMQVVRGE